MARYGDIVDVLKSEVKLVRSTRAASKSSLALPLIRSALKQEDSGVSGGMTLFVSFAEVTTPLTAPQGDMDCVLVGDTTDLIELLGDEPQFDDVIDLCTAAVVKQLESRFWAA